MIQAASLLNESQRDSGSAQLAGVCIDHLNRERDLLERVLSTLTEIGTALVANDLASLSNLLGHYQVLEQNVRVVQQARDELKQRVASSLTCAAHEVSLLRFEASLEPGLRDELRETRLQVIGLTRDIETRSRCNALLLRQSMQFIQHMMFCLTGHDESAQRYGASGQMGHAVSGPTIQKRC